MLGLKEECHSMYKEGCIKVVEDEEGKRLK